MLEAQLGRDHQVKYQTMPAVQAVLLVLKHRIPSGAIIQQQIVIYYIYIYHTFSGCNGEISRFILDEALHVLVVETFETSLQNSIMMPLNRNEKKVSAPRKGSIYLARKAPLFTFDICILIRPAEML